MSLRSFQSQHSSVICSECPRMLTRRQAARGGVVCSRTCSGQRRKRLWTAEMWEPHIQKAIAGMRQANWKRIVSAIVADVKAIAVAGQVLDREAVKLAVKWRRIGYSRGYGALCAARRHALVKQAS